MYEYTRKKESNPPLFSSSSGHLSSDNISLGVTISLAGPKISAACVPLFVSMELGKREEEKEYFAFGTRSILDESFDRILK